MHFGSQIFRESREIRTDLIKGDPWFVAKDVCDVLDIENASLAVNGCERIRDDGSNYWNSG